MLGTFRSASCANGMIPLEALQGIIGYAPMHSPVPSALRTQKWTVALPIHYRSASNHVWRGNRLMSASGRLRQGELDGASDKHFPIGALAKGRLPKTTYDFALPPAIDLPIRCERR